LFADDVMFSHNGPYDDVRLPQHLSAVSSIYGLNTCCLVLLA